MSRRTRIRAGAVAASTGVVVLGSLALATSASAHVPTVTHDCKSITVDAKDYNPDPKVNNTVTVIIDGKTVIDAQKFGASYNQVVPVPAHTGDVSAEVKVLTDEDRIPPGGTSGPHGWSIDDKFSIAPCQESPSPSPSVKPTGSPSAKPSGSPSASVSPSASSTVEATASPSTAPSGAQLAHTGGSGSSTAIAATGAGVVLLGGGLFFVARRRRSVN